MLLLLSGLRLGWMVTQVEGLNDRYLYPTPSRCVPLTFDPAFQKGYRVSPNLEMLAASARLNEAENPYEHVCTCGVRQ
jgi:hypothetical protein